MEKTSSLRKRPLRELSAEDMDRPIAQDVGLCRLLPPTLDHLRTTAPREPGQLGRQGGALDEDHR